MKTFSKIMLLVIIKLIFTTNGQKLRGYQKLAESREIFSGTYFPKILFRKQIPKSISLKNVNHQVSKTNEIQCSQRLLNFKVKIFNDHFIISTFIVFYMIL